MRAFLLVLLNVLLVAMCGCARPVHPGDPLPGLDAEQRKDFERGRAVFERTFVPETGLGPLFNADGCAECHEDPVTGGVGDELELHAARLVPLVQAAAMPAPGPAAGCDLLLAEGGPVYQLHVTPALHDALGIDSEPFPPDARTAQRTVPDLFGFGLLDAVPDAEILAHSDPDDANGDGISGRPNRFTDGRIGRFGRKAFIPALAEFNSTAFQLEQGVTVPAALEEGTVGGQPLPPDVDPTPEPELDAESVRLADAFVRFLAPPKPRFALGAAAHGKRIFSRIGCAACHLPVLHTGPNPVQALSHRKVAAYTDLLLHDMGPDLADICFGEATPSEFRTEPLMGLRFSVHFLHDGRAASIEQAIGLHGGEASASSTRFGALSPRDRAALLAFLQTL